MVAYYLWPVQRMLSSLVVPLRSVRRVMNWEDRVLTALAMLGLLASALVCVLIPWGLVLHVALRLLGLAIFGPHMFWVGERLARQAEADARAEREYVAADDKGKKAILRQHRERLMAEHEARLDDTACQSQIYNREAAQYLRDAKHVAVVEELRTSARLKYHARPDPHRSRAYPLKSALDDGDQKKVQ